MKTQTYRYKNVAIGGGGFITGIIHNPCQKDLVYLRTDVGGAYRWDASQNTWAAMQDGFGPEDWNVHGVESLATDPVDPARVYLACGTYTSEKVPNAQMLRSADYGVTWEVSPLPFKMGGNEAGRGMGERLAVDPLDNRRIWMGTRRDGLWESLDFGATWHRLENFPLVEDGSAGITVAPGTWNFLAQAVGISQVLFDPASATEGRSGAQKAWAAVSRHHDGLYYTTDGGASWAPVPGQPQGLRPTCLSLARDGMLFVSWSKDPGPNTMGPGALWRLDTRTGEWTDITPEAGRFASEMAGSPGKVPYGMASVCVDAQDPARLICTTWHRAPMDEVFVSCDRGATWKTSIEGARWDHSQSPYSSPMRHHWLADASMDPFDPGRVIFTTGYGIWTCPDIRPAQDGKPVTWIFQNQGIEETVPLSLLSPRTTLEEPRLVSGVGDIDGFVHVDFDLSPKAGRFDQPGYKNTECIADCPGNPRLLVRSGTTYHRDRIHVAWSRDAGLSWQAFASQPPEAEGSSKVSFAGPIALNADGSRVVWTPGRGRPWFTDDWGQTWEPCGGLDGFIRVVPDPDDPAVFYAWDTAVGRFLVSRDKGENFEVTARGLPTLFSPWGPVEGQLTVLPARFGTMLLAADKQLYRSRDGGLTWAALPGLKVFQFGLGAASPDRTDGFPAVFFQGQVEEEKGLFRSDDALESWIRINDRTMGFPTLRIIQGDSLIHGRVYLGTGGRGIFWGEPV